MERAWDLNGKPDSGIDVLCVGHASHDLIFIVDHHPEADGKCFARAMQSCGGGPAANAAVAVARLGGRSALTAYLGEDLYGCLHHEELVEEGVNTDCITRGPHPTPLSVILVKPNGDRSVINHKSGTPPLSSVPCDLGAVSPGVILFDGHEPRISPVLAREARARGIPSILDAGSVHPGSVDLLSLVDCVVASERFSREYTGEVDPEKALVKLRERVAFTAVTLGGKGVVWSDKADTARLAAFPVDAVDTTGAGDTFHGAFALCLARGMDSHSSLLYSSAAAALCCTRVGARTGIPTRRELEAFLHARSSAHKDR